MAYLNKALVFEQQLGHTRDNYEGLLRQIQDRALDAEAVTKEADRHGQYYQVDLEIIGVDGQTAIVVPDLQRSIAHRWQHCFQTFSVKLH